MGKRFVAVLLVGILSISAYAEDKRKPNTSASFNLTIANVTQAIDDAAALAASNAEWLKKQPAPQDLVTSPDLDLPFSVLRQIAERTRNTERTVAVTEGALTQIEKALDFVTRDWRSLAKPVEELTKAEQVRDEEEATLNEELATKDKMLQMYLLVQLNTPKTDVQAHAQLAQFIALLRKKIADLEKAFSQGRATRNVKEKNDMVLAISKSRPKGEVEAVFRWAKVKEQWERLKKQVSEDGKPTESLAALKKAMGEFMKATYVLEGQDFPDRKTAPGPISSGTHGSKKSDTESKRRETAAPSGGGATPEPPSPSQTLPQNITPPSQPH